jgi:hypothetical protein
MAVYNKAEYWEEKVVAMDQWAERIRQLASSKKVLKLNKKAK